jgi:hypothetical protein
MSDIIAAMGRMRIKKKSDFIPFPQTLAYRMILITFSILLFAYATYRAISSLYGDSVNAIMLSSALMLITGFAVYYNMSHLKDARVSPAAAKRMKRRV